MFALLAGTWYYFRSSLFMAQVYIRGFINVRIFSGLDDTKERVLAGLCKELSLDNEADAAAQVDMALLLSVCESCRTSGLLTNNAVLIASLGSKAALSLSQNMQPCVRQLTPCTIPCETRSCQANLCSRKSLSKLKTTHHMFRI